MFIAVFGTGNNALASCLYSTKRYTYCQSNLSDFEIKVIEYLSVQFRTPLTLSRRVRRKSEPVEWETEYSNKQSIVRRLQH